MATNFTDRKRTGVVTPEAFDKGLVESLGAFVLKREIVPGESIVGQEEVYALVAPGVSDNPVRVIFGDPEQPFLVDVIPALIVLEEDPALALDRWHSVGYEYVAGVGQAVEAHGQDGYTKGEKQPFAYPCDYNYTLQLRTRLRRQAKAFRNYILNRLTPHGNIWVLDSLGERRGYTAFIEGMSRADELDSTTARRCVYNISVRVMGEWNMEEPIQQPTFYGDTQVNMGKLQ